MGDKSSFRIKLAAYSAVASFFLFVKENSSAQILYTDINPDIHDPSHYLLDLNNDGVVDFAFSFCHYSWATGTYSAYLLTYVWNYMAVETKSENQVMGSGGEVSKLNGGITIGNSAQWSSGYLLMASLTKCECAYGITNQAGQWFNIEDGYLGLRLSLNGHYYYGWLRLKVSTDADDIYFKDYALNIVPDQSILAGEVSIPSGGIPENATDFHVLQTENGIVIRTSSMQQFTTSLVDVDGREIQRIEKQTSEQFIPTANLAAGIYFVRLKTPEQNLVKKIFIR